MHFFRQPTIDQARDDALRDIGDPLLLLYANQQIPPHFIDGLTLLIHHIVILENVFAACEVLRFHLFLRGRDTPRNHLAFDGYILFHPQLEHEVLNALASENAQQIVL